MSVFSDGIESGIYTDVRTIKLVRFYSSEDDAWFVMPELSHGLSAHGETPCEALKEFCVMLPAALDSGLSVEDIAEASTARMSGGS